MEAYYFLLSFVNLTIHYTSSVVACSFLPTASSSVTDDKDFVVSCHVLESDDIAATASLSPCRVTGCVIVEDVVVLLLSCPVVASSLSLDCDDDEW